MSTWVYKEVDISKNMVDKLFDRIQKCESSTAKTTEKIKDIHNEVDSSKNKVDELFLRVQKCESSSSNSFYEFELQKQILLKNNVVFVGIPVVAGEDLYAIVQSIAVVVGIKVNFEDISGLYRVKDSHSHLIVLQLNSFSNKLKFMRGQRKIKVQLKDVMPSYGEGSTETIIYLNNHLTPYFAHLLHQGRKAKQNGSISACWVSNREFFVKRNDHEIAKEIKSVEHLLADTQCKNLEISFDKVQSTKNRRESFNARPKKNPNQHFFSTLQKKIYRVPNLI